MNVQPRAYLKVLRMGRGTGEQGSWLMDRPSSLWLAFPANFLPTSNKKLCMLAFPLMAIYLSPYASSP